MRLTNFVIDKENRIRSGIANSFGKAHVKHHTRKSKSGKLSQVKEHERKVLMMKKKLEDLKSKIKKKYGSLDTYGAREYEDRLEDLKIKIDTHTHEAKSKKYEHLKEKILKKAKERTKGKTKVSVAVSSDYTGRTKLYSVHIDHDYLSKWNRKHQSVYREIAKKIGYGASFDAVSEDIYLSKEGTKKIGKKELRRHVEKVLRKIGLSK